MPGQSIAMGATAGATLQHGYTLSDIYVFEEHIDNLSKVPSHDVALLNSITIVSKIDYVYIPVYSPCMRLFVAWE